MYSWGDDTSVSRRSGGYGYGSARAAYDPGRGYGSTPKSRSTRTYAASSAYDNSPSGRTITTDSESPIVIALDLTGSMGSWREVFFDKLPLLWKPDEGITKYYPNAELSFASIGDACCDYKPLQVTDFKKGKDLDSRVASLSMQGGGGNSVESYDLAAYFYANKCEMPNAKRPLMFIAGDEGFYKNINPDWVKQYIGDDLTERLDTANVLKQLQSKFDVYVLRKKYSSGSVESRIDTQWREIFGEKVIMLEEPKRIVDTILGITASTAGQFGTFYDLLSKRQTPAQVQQVMKSMRAMSLHDPKQIMQGHTVRQITGGGKKSTKLK